jgi:hypothetical protein
VLVFLQQWELLALVGELALVPLLVLGPVLPLLHYLQ